MYLPKSKYKKENASGNNFVDKVTGAPYTGPVVADFLGRFFKGSSPLNLGSELRKVPNIITLENLTETQSEGNQTLLHKYLTPTQQDYDKGTFSRFFCKDSRTGRIVEIDQDSYNDIRKQQKLYLRVLNIEWYITGNPEDEIINGYLYPGTKAKNRDVIVQAEEILPGIGEQILKDPGQFVK